MLYSWVLQDKILHITKDKLRNIAVLVIFFKISSARNDEGRRLMSTLPMPYKFFAVASSLSEVSYGKLLIVI